MFSISEIGNYRGISILPPLSKLFEKVLTNQIVCCFNKNKLLFKGQHGFREDHSLHEIISDLNNILSIISTGGSVGS